MAKIKTRMFVILLFAVFSMMITINATITDGTIPYTLPNYITGTYRKIDGNYNDISFARAYTQSTFGIRISRYVSTTGRVPYISRLYTGLETGKLYKFQYTFSDNIIQGVGDIAPTNNNYMAIVSPANLSGHNLDAYIDSNIPFVTEQNPYVLTGYTYSIPNDSYRMFYDSNNKTLTCIMILPDDYFEGQEILQMHCYLMVTLGAVTTDQIENVTVQATDSIPLKVNGDYTDILNQISDKLDNISGIGITEDEINEAIQDALTAHDEQLEHESSSKFEELLGQIDSYTHPYKEASEEIKDALHGFSDVFNSTSTSAVFTFPAGIMPNGVVLWQEHLIDIGAAWLNIPETLRAIITVVATFTILLTCAKEAIYIIKYVMVGEWITHND